MTEKPKTNNVSNNNFLKYILIVLIVAIAAYFVFNYFSDKKENNYKVKSNDELLNNVKEPQFIKQGELEFLKKDNKTVISKIDIEIADNEAKTMQGLMYRKSMEENRGMIFIFLKAEEHAFWMKNTLISLDIIFIDANKKIIKIHKHTTPQSTKSLPSGGPTLYVVEVNAGYTDKFGINEGDMINFTRQ
ncbi:MAG: DUF192 domain-containing protein [Ignavibacteriae bacterium]|nr:DUF192 domain-containing protein [Ignavibacteriota bacterium]